jgi:hypothetical protein
MPSKAKTIVVVLAVVALYTAGYALARWRGFVVMYELHIKEERVALRKTGLGRDIREDWRGKLKNQLNPAVFYFFWPVAKLEDFVRGGKVPY